MENGHAAQTPAWKTNLRKLDKYAGPFLIVAFFAIGLVEMIGGNVQIAFLLWYAGLLNLYIEYLLYLRSQRQ